MPKYDGATPTKPDEEGASYTFTGWSPEVSKVTGDATYTAQFAQMINVTWKNYDGEVLKTTKIVYGTTPVYDGATPTKPNDGHDHTFIDWSCSVSSSTNDIEYTALFGMVLETDSDKEQMYRFNLLDDDTYEIFSVEDKKLSFGTNVIVPSKYKNKPVTKIKRNAFVGINSLTSIVIPKSVTTIEEGAVANCPSLIVIKVKQGNTKYNSKNNCNAIIETESNKLIATCKNTVILNSVTKIGERAFWGRNDLKTFVIPKSVKFIAQFAFYECSSLTSVIIPKTVAEIERAAFALNPKLKIYVEYERSPEGWAAVFSDDFTGESTFWYSETPNQDGRHWRYVDGKPKVWK